jgi:ribosomal protein S15P/S13E
MVSSRWLAIWAGLLALALLIAPRVFSQASQTPYIPKPVPRTTGVLLPEANRTPDANDVMQMREQKVSKAKFEAANKERKRQMDEDSALLLKLAKELKLELEETPKDELSQSMLHKAEDIERLARNVQQKMKLTVGAAN